MGTFKVDFRIGFEQPAYSSGGNLAPDLSEIKQLEPPLLKNLGFPLCHHLLPSSSRTEAM